METGQEYLHAQRELLLSHPANEWRFPAASAIKPKERLFVVDSGASMHLVSREDLKLAELETVRISQNATTVVAANGEVQTLRSDSVCQRIGFICDRNAS